ncbi:MAG: hypothetical protein HY332_14060 [Chloroflexi bacterium]|nr:hypothetical protein [Chloroflexota bacterium]
MDLQLDASASASPDNPTWPAMPEQVEALSLRWAAEYPARCRLVSEPSPSGYDVYVVDVRTPCTADTPSNNVPHALVVQPHAQEPAATPAIMEFLSELITGRRLDGTRTSLPSKALAACRFSVNPVGNPDGRSRMPTVCWTPAFSREEKRFYCNGKERDGGAILDERSKAMRLSEVDLDPRYPVGCRLEHCGGGLYADPRGWPGDLESNPTTLARILRRILPQHRYTLAVEMHQSEVHDFPYILLAEHGDARAQANAADLGAAIENAWRAAGYPVGPCVRLPATGFVHGIHTFGAGRPPVLCIEVGEGMSVSNPWMTPARQKEAGVIALHAVVGYLLAAAP